MSASAQGSAFTMTLNGHPRRDSQQLQSDNVLDGGAFEGSRVNPHASRVTTCNVRWRGCRPCCLGRNEADSRVHDRRHECSERDVGLIPTTELTSLHWLHSCSMLQILQILPSAGLHIPQRLGISRHPNIALSRALHKITVHEKVIEFVGGTLYSSNNLGRKPLHLSRSSERWVITNSSMGSFTFSRVEMIPIV